MNDEMEMMWKKAGRGLISQIVCLDEPRDLINNLSREIQIISRNFNHGYYDYNYTYVLRNAELCYLLVALIGSVKIVCKKCHLMIL
jgi:hypothetical protein